MSSALSTELVAEPAEEAGVEAPEKDLTPLWVGLAASSLSIGSTWYYFVHHLVLGYDDSFSHLEISRRVVSGLSPGIAQLGGVWLPVPQLLQGLFSWNYTLYRTGLAGSFVSMASYVTVTVLLYRLIMILGGQRKWAAVAGALAFAVNANVLYQQVTSMDELPFYAFLIGAVYYLTRWAERRQATDLLAASIASMLAMLCRYEGWFLAGIFALCVVLMSWRLGYSWRNVRGLTIVFAAFGLLLSLAGWTIYNYLIFDNPLNFENGPDSSAAQMAQRKSSLVTDSWPLSLKGYGFAVAADLGLAMVALAVIGLALFLLRERFSARSIPLLGLLTLIPFYVYSLKKGAEPISIPQTMGFLLNYRFGLVIAMPAAVLVGYLLSQVPDRVSPAPGRLGKVPAVLPAALATIVGLTALSAVSFAQHHVVLPTEAAQDLYTSRNQISAGNFLQQHTSGLVLIDIVQNERVDFDAVDRSVYDGTKEDGHNQWHAVLDNPKAFGIKVIVMRLPNPAEPEDSVYGALYDSPLLRPYHLVYLSKNYLIYEW
jgi:hypothetical protein